MDHPRQLQTGRQARGTQVAVRGGDRVEGGDLETVSGSEQVDDLGAKRQRSGTLGRRREPTTRTLIAGPSRTGAPENARRQRKTSSERSIASSTVGHL